MFGLPWYMLFIAYWPLIAALAGGFYLGLRAVRALERRAAANGQLEALEARMLTLEEHLSTLGERLDRLSEGQEFTTRLLSDKK